MTSTQNPHPDAGSHPEAYSHLEEYSYQDASCLPEAKSHPEAELLEEADFHPEVDLHPEVNVLALAESLDMRKLKSISQRVQESDCTNDQKCQLFFRSLWCRVSLRQSQHCSLKVWEAFFQMRQNWRQGQIQIWRPH